MNKLISYRKEFTPKKGENLRDIAYDLIEGTDFINYLKHMQGEVIILSMEPASVKSEKEKMYAYYQKVVLSVAVLMFNDLGWEGIDKDSADEQLKKILAKDYVININTGEKIIKQKPKSRMPKQELRNYIHQCILLLEGEGYKVPEADEYKSELQTGLKGWKTMK